MLRTGPTAARRFDASAAYMRDASQRIPRGTASAMRASQRPHPLAFQRASGSRIVDLDGNEYVDYVLGFGATFLGHSPPSVIARVTSQLERGVIFGGQHPAELELAELVARTVPAAEVVAPMTTGSEAVHAALKIARVYTGRQLVVKFVGHYHGWLDPLHVDVPGMTSPGDAENRPRSATPGLAVPPHVTVLEWNDSDAIRRLFAEQGKRIAAVVMEPIPCNAGAFRADPGYLDEVRSLCDSAGAVLIFDEVLTGYRMSLGGAQQHLGVVPDLAVLGKALGSGFPLAVVAGGHRVMSVATSGPLQLVGTFNGSPLAVAAGIGTVRTLIDEAPEIFERSEANALALRRALSTLAASRGLRLTVCQAGPVLQLLWGTSPPIRSYRQVAGADRDANALFSEHLLRLGVHTLARGVWFVSPAHGIEEIEFTIETIAKALDRTLTDDRLKKSSRGGVSS